jgi:hypothetical protein
MKNYELQENKKGNKNLIFEDIIYNNDTRQNNQNAWRCSNRKCSAKGSVSSSGVFVLITQHKFACNDKNKIILLKNPSILKRKQLNTLFQTGKF